MSRLMTTQPLSVLLALVVIILASTAAVAQEYSSGNGAKGSVGQVQYLEDPQGQWAVDDLVGRQDWQATEGSFNQGYSRSTWWLKVPLTNSGTDTLAGFLEIGYPMLDHLDVYLVDGGQVLERYSLGDKQPFDSRLVSHQNFIVPLELPPGAERTLYLEITSSSIIQAPLTLWDRDSFLEANFNDLFTSGLFFGALILIAAYNLLLAIGLRDKSYLFYVGYVLGMTLFLASIDGLAFRFLWPHAPHWSNQLVVMSLPALTVFAGLFARSLLDIPRFSRALDIVTVTHISLAFLLLVSSLALPYETAIQLGMLAALSGSAISLWAGPSAWLHKQPAGKYYTYAWTTLFLCGFLHLLGRFGVFNAPWLTNNIMAVGVTAEVLILSLALGERINSERQQRVSAQLEALAAEERATAELEHRVAQRNEELAVLNAQLKALTHTDQLTALSNRRHFESHLHQEFARCRRNQRPLTLALLDIDHFKNVNDRWGHQVGDRCLQVLARHMEEATRGSGTMAARLGGEEFCLLFPELDAGEAYGIAERLRLNIEGTPIASAGDTLHVTVSIGLATTIPGAGGSAEQLLKEADLAMYDAKNSGRNRVRTARDSDSQETQIRRTLDRS